MTLPEFEALEEFYNKNVISRKEYLDLLIGGGTTRKKRSSWSISRTDFISMIVFRFCRGRMGSSSDIILNIRRTISQRSPNDKNALHNERP